MRADRLALLAVCGLVLAGCAEPPFAARTLDYNLEKPNNPVLTSGFVEICYSDSASWEQIQAEADDACGEYGYFAQFSQTQRYQCRVTAPHQSRFRCYHPEMTNTKGRLILPSDTKAIEEWQKRTGKMKPKPRVSLPLDQQGLPPSATLPNLPKAPGSPPAQEGDGASQTATQPVAGTGVLPASPGGVPILAPTRPLRPEDIAGRPGVVDGPILAEPPPQVPLYPSGSSYTLPPSTWGSHFED